MIKKISFMGNFNECMRLRQKKTFHVLRADGKSDTQPTYAECVAHFSNHMVSVLALQSPLQQLIDSGGSPLSATQIEQYSRLLYAVHTAARAWTEKTDGLYMIPDSFNNLSRTMNAEFANAIAYASRLKNDPENEDLIREFNNQLSNCCLDLTTNLKGNTDALIKTLADYSQQLIKLHDALTGIVTQAMSDHDADQTKLNNLKSEIEAAQDKINGLATGIGIGVVTMIGSGIAVGIAGGSGPIGWLCGLVIAGLLIAGAVTTAVCGYLLGVEQNLKAGLEAQKAPLETAIVVLKAYADQVKVLATDSDGLNAQLRIIQEPWEKLSDDLDAASEALNNAVSASDKTHTTIDWEGVAKDLDTARGYLPTLQKEARALNIAKVQVMDTSGLDKDMSADALAKAFNNAPKMDFDKFIYKKYA